VDVLKTRAELGGISPDINNPNHFKLVSVYRNVDAQVSPSDELAGGITVTDGPFSIITTWLFDEKPVTTEGLRIIFTRNCDKFERDTYANATDFSNFTGCPDNNILFGPSDWVSDRGIGAGYFVPLESVDNTNLPIDNVKEAHIGTAANNNANVYAAVDLGRHHDIDTDTDLFELIALTPSQSEFNTGSVLFSSDNTDDPNQVNWAGTSSNARWIRFVTNATQKFEDRATDSVISKTSGLETIFVDTIPQAEVYQARIYPNIGTTLFPTEGYNSSWDDLGTTLSDNKTSTSIFYSDYPIIALDLGTKYLISNDASVIRSH
jgi:hypothetical protein